MNLVVTILIGVAVGVMVELLLPGHTLPELFLAILLGTAGALLARYLGEVVGWYGTDQPESFVASGIGAVLLLAFYGVLFRPRIRHHHQK